MFDFLFRKFPVIFTVISQALMQFKCKMGVKRKLHGWARSRPSILLAKYVSKDHAQFPEKRRSGQLMDLALFLSLHSLTTLATKS